MGSSKSNTGIGFIDNAVDYSVNNIVNPAAKNTEQAYGEWEPESNGKEYRQAWRDIQNIQINSAGLSRAGAFRNSGLDGKDIGKQQGIFCGDGFGRTIGG